MNTNDARAIVVHFIGEKNLERWKWSNDELTDIASGIAIALEGTYRIRDPRGLWVDHEVPERVRIALGDGNG